MNQIYQIYQIYHDLYQTDQIDHDLDHLDFNLPLVRCCAGICKIVQIQPRKHILDNAGYTAPIGAT